MLVKQGMTTSKEEGVLYAYFINVVKNTTPTTKRLRFFWPDFYERVNRYTETIDLAPGKSETIIERFDH